MAGRSRRCCPEIPTPETLNWPAPAASVAPPKTQKKKLQKRVEIASPGSKGRGRQRRNHRGARLPSHLSLPQNVSGELPSADMPAKRSSSGVRRKVGRRRKRSGTAELVITRGVPRLPARRGPPGPIRRSGPPAPSWPPRGRCTSMPYAMIFDGRATIPHTHTRLRALTLTTFTP